MSIPPVNHRVDKFEVKIAASGIRIGCPTLFLDAFYLLEGVWGANYKYFPSMYVIFVN